MLARACSIRPPYVSRVWLSAPRASLSAGCAVRGVGDQPGGLVHRVDEVLALRRRLETADQEGVGGVGVRADQVGVDRLDPDQLGRVRLGAGQGSVRLAEALGGGQSEDDAHGRGDADQDGPHPARRAGLPTRAERPPLSHDRRAGAGAAARPRAAADCRGARRRRRQAAATPAAPTMGVGQGGGRRGRGAGHGCVRGPACRSRGPLCPAWPGPAWSRGNGGPRLRRRAGSSVEVAATSI